ncbi:MAG: S8 family serine peptidase [Wenzhouxiangellaceae bacterium]
MPGAAFSVEGAMQQIQALYQEKLTRSPAQTKIDSQLLLMRDTDGFSIRQVSVPLRRHIALDASGRVEVDITARVSDGLLAAIEGHGGVIVNSVPRFNSIRAWLPLRSLEGLAEDDAVTNIRPADQYMLQMINTTEGDVAHATNIARSQFQVDGSGTLTCAMSDSVDALADLQTSGDLPPGVTVLPGQSGNPGTSEGTALLEIIFDMAPGADLAFATGSGGAAQMAQNILDLAALGCNIIVDDVLYLNEGVFQDDIIAQAVESVVADEVMYITSAGNSGNLSNGTAGVWEGDFAATALPAPLNGAGLAAHDFGGGENGNTITIDSPFFFTLQWADPLDGSGNDYDLFMLDSTLNTVLAASTNTQNGSQDPFEFIDSQAADDTNNRLVIVQFSGEARFLHLNTHRGQLDIGTDGQIFGHPAAANAITIAAVNVATAAGAPFAGGAANPVEVFSSDGPRRIFFNANGTPVNGANRGTMSVIRNKPDLTAADGVSTATPGFNPFFGTSASAPHAAGIAALMRELASTNLPQTGLFVNDATDILNSTALDIETPGFDRDSGNGIIMGDASLNDVPIFSDGFESGDTAAWSN